jgi:peptide/nickel transport system permease protein
MIRFVIGRLVSAVLTLLGVSLIVFAATQALPGNAARAILGQTATPERIEALEEQLDLHEPVASQYAGWLADTLRGDLGTSVATRQPVSDLIGTRVANTAFLVFLAAAVALPVAIGLGVRSAAKRDRLGDHLVTLTSLTIAALPEFVIGVSLILLFATSALHVLPAVSLVPPGEHVWTHLDVVALPALTLALAVTPYVSRIVRASMVEVLEEEYVQMAHLKGLSERAVIWRHAVPNGVAPALQASALSLAWMAGGVVTVEYVFQYNGVGLALVDAVGNHDVPVVQALVLLTGAVYVVLNLAADIGTILVTPKARTRLSGGDNAASEGAA